MGQALNDNKDTPFGSVLLVEDDPWVRLVLTHAMEDAGFSVSAVPGQVTADGLLDTSSGQSFDLLITDLELGDGDGGLLIKTAAARGMPSICITGYADRVPKAPSDTATTWLAKPFTLELLMGEIERALGHADKSSR